MLSILDFEHKLKAFKEDTELIAQLPTTNEDKTLSVYFLNRTKIIGDIYTNNDFALEFQFVLADDPMDFDAIEADVKDDIIRTTGEMINFLCKFNRNYTIKFDGYSRGIDTIEATVSINYTTGLCKPIALVWADGLYESFYKQKGTEEYLFDVSQFFETPARYKKWKKERGNKK